MVISEEPPRVRGVRTGLIPGGLFRRISWSWFHPFSCLHFNFSACTFKHANRRMHVKVCQKEWEEFLKSQLLALNTVSWISSYPPAFERKIKANSFMWYPYQQILWEESEIFVWQVLDLGAGIFKTLGPPRWGLFEFFVRPLCTPFAVNVHQATEAHRSEIPTPSSLAAALFCSSPLWPFEW